jgi:uncharacterized protein (TIGR02466 family)
MPVRAWFPTLVYEAPLMRQGAKSFNAELLREARQIRRVDEAGRRWCGLHYPGGFTSYNSMNQLHRTSSTFGELARRLARHVRAFARDLDFDMDGRKLSMTDCWVNVMPKHASHGLHLHPLATISGTYYVRTPRGASRLKFEDPRLASFMAAPPRKATSRPENRAFVYYPVTAGNVILFESWLRHEVDANRTDEERVSVSFNFNWF